MPVVGHPWPLMDLRLRTPRLELRSPSDDDIVALIAVAGSGIHAADVMPFKVAWTDLPSPDRERSSLRYFWGARATWTPLSWRLPMAVVLNGEPIGVQEMFASDFATKRTVHTGSWLGQRFQGQGIGTEMRAAVLFLAFDGLAALAAESAVVDGNEASVAVSRKLGYRANGETFIAPRGVPVVERRFRLMRDDWQRDRVDVVVENLEPCLELFGVDRS
jgi:RimJ/RimL family protein N-acetyltransferase